MVSWLNRKSNFLTRTILTCIGIIFLLPAFSIAAQLSLAWDSNAPPVDGYLLFMRADNNAYDYLSPVWSGTETTCTIDDRMGPIISLCMPIAKVLRAWIQTRLRLLSLIQSITVPVPIVMWMV